MPSIEIAAGVAEIVAALAVIVSVIYLAVQVRDANRMSQQQAYKDTLDLMHAPIEQLVGNSDLAEIVRRGGIEPDQLSDTEWFQYGFWWMMQFDMYEFLYSAHMDGRVVPHIWLGTDASWTNVIEEWPGVRKAWHEWRHAYSEGFKAYVDQKVDQAERGE
jgi:hypothetical protein